MKGEMLGRRKKTIAASSSSSNLPPWEVVVLLAQILDTKSLAMASCVSKSWHAVMSSDHLWKPICLSHYPSSLHMIAADDSPSPRRLFALLRASSQRRHRNPSVPRISLRHLIFAVDIFQHDMPLFSLAKPGIDEFGGDHGGVFRFDVVVNVGNTASLNIGEEVRIVWTIVTKGWTGAFTMMDRVEKGRRAVGGTGLWFSEELPRPGCCSASMGGWLEAELGLEFFDDGGGSVEGRRKVERMRLGLMSIADWRYLTVDDSLLYLQAFLQPNNI